MSQALYRRYRPETFADVIGQEHVTEPLQQALRTGRVSHAYLFSGPRGCGKTTSARILARCLNCDQGPTDVPCGSCDSCVALARGGAGTVDVIEIDAASHGGVDDARELRERASYGPAHSRYKIYIIDEAHMVTPQGFNALLKIVEEPPEHVKFVFATTEPEKVIGTIRSRTHHYPFRLVPPAQLQDYLGQVCGSEGVEVEPGVLSFVVRAGGGSVRDSLSVLDQLIAGSGEQGLTYEGAAALLGFTDAELLDATVTAIGHGDAAQAFAQVDRVIETGLDPRRFVEDLLERLRDLIICAAVPDGAEGVLRMVPPDQLERMYVQAGSFGAGGLSRAADVVNTGLTEMTGTTSPRLQLELIIARLLLPGAAGPQGYAARLDRIERRLDMWVREGAPAHSTQPPGGPAPAAAMTPGRSPAGSALPGEMPVRSGVPSSEVPSGEVRSGAATSRADGGALPASSSPKESVSGGTTSSGADEVSGGPSVSGDSSVTRGPSVSGDSSVSRGPSVSGDSSVSGESPSPGDASTQRPASPPESGPTSSVAGRDQAAIVRAWPDILDWLSRNKRVTWTLVSASAQPLSFDGSRLVLAIDTAGLAETFRRGAHPGFVQEALLEVLGIDARVEGVVSQTAPDAARSGTGSHAAGPITSPWSAKSASHQPRSANSEQHAAHEQTSGEASSPARSAGSPSPATRAAAPPRPASSGPASSGPASSGPASSGPGPSGAGSSGSASSGSGLSGAASSGPASSGPGSSDSGSSRPASSERASSAPSAAAVQPDWSSAPPPASSAPSWASDDGDGTSFAPGRGAPSDVPTPVRERLASVVPIRKEDRGPAVSPAGSRDGLAAPEEVILDGPDTISDGLDAISDDPDAISEDDEDIEASGEVGQAVVERLLGGTVISEDPDS